MSHADWNINRAKQFIIQTPFNRLYDLLKKNELITDRIVTLFAENVSSVPQGVVFKTLGALPGRNDLLPKVVPLINYVQNLEAEFVNIHERDVRDSTYLHLAAKIGKVEVVAQLLKAGADSNAVDCEGNTPLHLATLKNRYDCFIKLLETEATKIDEKNKEGNTPLHLAAFNGNLHSSYVLYSQGADINAKNRAGDTPLMLAARNGRRMCLLDLVKSKANLHEKNNEGNTALHLLFAHKYYDLAFELIKSGASLTILNKQNKSPLDLCPPELREKARQFVP